MSGYTIIDADTHVTETPDLWTSRAPASMRDRVPRVEKNADGSLAGCGESDWLRGGPSDEGVHRPRGGARFPVRTGLGLR